MGWGFVVVVRFAFSRQHRSNSRRANHSYKTNAGESFGLCCVSHD